MPCNCDYMGPSEAEHLGQYLCWLCGNLEDGDQLDILHPEIAAWWEEHKKQDTERVTREMVSLKQRNDRRKKTKRVIDPVEVADEFIHFAEKVHPVSDFHRRWFLNLACEVFGEE